MTRILVVPGAAVRGYVRPATDELARRGFDVELLPAPGEPGVPADLAQYGRALGGDGADLLVGLSVGAQAAAVAAATPTSPEPARFARLMLVGPTVDPAARTTPRLLGRWLLGGRREDPALLRDQLPEWRRAGARRISAVVRSATRLHVERLLPAVTVPVHIVHAERDAITSHAYAASLAAGHRLTIVPGATHSWPHGDPRRFADLVEEALR